MTTTTTASQAEPPADEKTVRIVIKEETEAIYLIPVSRLEEHGISETDTCIEDEDYLVTDLLQGIEPYEYSVLERTSTLETD